METEFKLTLEIIIGLMGSLFSIYFALYYNTKTNLKQSLYRKNKISVLEAHTFEEKYKTNLRNLIAWIDNIYNNSTLIQNYSRHVTIALLYSFMVFLLFWVLGAKGEIGTILILGETSTSNKLQTLAFFIIYILAIYLLYNKLTNLIEFIMKELPAHLQQNNILKMFITLLVVIVVEVIIIVEGLEVVRVGIVGLGGGKVVGVGVVVLSTLFLIPSIFLIKKTGLGLNLIIFGLMFLGYIPINNSTDQEFIYVLILFLILLPLTNSLLDYISLKISKYMAKQIIEDNSILTILLHILADLIIAILLLLNLALFLHFSVMGLNMFIDNPIPMREMLLSTWDDPFSIKNGWITFMLLSTLVPTVVHLVLALGALFVAIMPSSKSLKELKIYNKGQEALLENAAHYFTRIAFMQTFFSFVILVLISLPFWYDKL
jgi:hypothetical protein